MLVFIDDSWVINGAWQYSSFPLPTSFSTPLAEYSRILPLHSKLSFSFFSLTFSIWNSFYFNEKNEGHQFGTLLTSLLLPVLSLNSLQAVAHPSAYVLSFHWYLDPSPSHLFYFTLYLQSLPLHWHFLFGLKEMWRFLLPLKIKTFCYLTSFSNCWYLSLFLFKCFENTI